MFRRLSAWHILTAGLIGLSSAACGSGAREDVASHEKTAIASAIPPSVTRGGTELASVKPVAGEPVPAVEPEGEPEAPAAIVKSKDEVLDRLVFEAERDPDDVGARVRAARALLDAGKLREARTHAERAVEVDEESAGAWHTLGRIELAERDFAAAASSFQHAVEVEDENSYAWNNLGMAYEHVDRIREARAAYRQAAQGGSEKGQANVERLEGVTSLIPAAPAPAEHDGEVLPPEDGQGSSGSAAITPQDEEPGC